MTDQKSQVITDLTRTEEVVLMMEELYREDPSDGPVDGGRFHETLRYLVNHPARGQVVLFLISDILCGYALLVPYWSNEFGGTIVCIDELFVKLESRKQGIARSFFDFIEKTRPFDSVNAELEVTPSNRSARSFYEGIGFRNRVNSTMVANWGFVK